MANDSTTSQIPQDPVVKHFDSPKSQTVSFIRQFARAYTFLGSVALGSCMAN